MKLGEAKCLNRGWTLVPHTLGSICYLFQHGEEVAIYNMVRNSPSTITMSMWILGAEVAMAAPASSIYVPQLLASMIDALANWLGEDFRAPQLHQRARSAATTPTSLHSPCAAIELCMPSSLHLPKHQNDVAPTRCKYMFLLRGDAGTRKGTLGAPER